jgi:hypothetical protein
MAAAVTMLSHSLAAAPATVAGARALPVDQVLPVEQVQHGTKRRSGRFIDNNARDSFITNRLSRMAPGYESDGTILIPGIANTHRGRTVITGAPRSRTGTPQRVGVPRTGTGGRRTGGVPPVKHRGH